MQNKAVFYKYSLKLMWPAICRNRSVEILKERPDLVDHMNNVINEHEEAVGAEKKQQAGEKTPSSKLA